MKVFRGQGKDEGERAGRLAGSHALSLADAWIAAAALPCGATLLHNDPEFQAIDGLAQEWLA